MSGLSFLRKKQPDVKAQVRASQRDIARGNKDLEREAGALHAEEQKLVGEIKQAANRGDMASAKLLARQLVRLRAHKARLRTTGAQLRGVSASLTVRARRQLAVPPGGRCGEVLIAGCLQRVAAAACPIANAHPVPPQTAAATGAVGTSMASVGRAMAAVGAAADLPATQHNLAAFARESARLEMAGEVMDGALEDGMEGEADDVVSQASRYSQLPNLLHVHAGSPAGLPATQLGRQPRIVGGSGLTCGAAQALTQRLEESSEVPRATAGCTLPQVLDEIGVDLATGLRSAPWLQRVPTVAQREVKAAGENADLAARIAQLTADGEGG